MNARPATGRLGMTMVLVAVLTCAAALLAIDARATYGARTTADEPQYLVTALSLGEDLDLDISDELDDEAYRPFHEVRLNQQTISLNAAGQRLSPHDPLLPVILAVPMRLGGWALAKATLAVIAGATAAATLWVAVRRFGVGLAVGAAVVVGFFLSPPLIAYGSQVYPEMPAALATIVGLGAVTGSLRRRGLLVLVLCVVALPWLAVKYAPVAAVLAGYAAALLWRRGRQREMWLLGGGLAVAGVLYLLVHQRIYGGWTVYASGDHFVDGEFNVVGSSPRYWGRSRRLVGLLFDRTFGLVAWAPAYVALVPAVALLVKKRIAGSLPVVLVLAAGWFMATWVALTMHGWWWPGRQVVIVLPVAVVAIAVLANRFRIWFVAVLAGAALGFIGWCWLVFEATTDRLTLIVDFFQTANPWYRIWAPLLPDHIAGNSGALLLSLVWVGVVAGATVLTLRASGSR